MRIKPTTTVGRLLAEHPEAAEVMAWHGIDLEEFRPSFTLAGLCRGHRLDVDEVIEDLTSSLEVEEDEDDLDDDDEEISGEEPGEDDDGQPPIADDDLDDDLDDLDDEVDDGEEQAPDEAEPEEDPE